MFKGHVTAQVEMLKKQGIKGVAQQIYPGIFTNLGYIFPL
jgi:hypothetical protein